ncbi:MAG: hypothetical protein M3X11_18195 [Acidobacteriota bacterium]|nr:hypothetical protein [Acidobacteriota bacterium]
MANALNKRQKQILLFGIALIALSELFPPWVYFNRMTSGKRSAGYHFFKNKPEVKSRAEMLEMFPDSEERYDLMQAIEVQRDSIQILLQRLFLSLFTLVLIILFKNNLSLGWKVLAGLIICLGIPPFYFWLYVFRLENLTPH